ncbi:MAG: FMN-binding protein [Bacteroidales bacterium]|nr:FMN-binding protein [Bacteroidales bacterium]
MNTNSNVYTVIYTTVVCVLVAAVLAFVSQSLKSRQADNEKAETISQILTAAQFGEKEHWQEIGNAKTIEFFKENINGENTRIYSTSDLKALNYKIKDGIVKSEELPRYVFNNGIVVLPVYGAGLWGPVWGYIAIADDYKTVTGAYFDHASETPGLGGKIKDDPAFRAQFAGKKVIYDGNGPLSIIKGGAPAGMENAVDAITGATMTSKGLHEAIATWLNAYKDYIEDAREVGEAIVTIVNGIEKSGTNAQEE